MATGLAVPVKIGPGGRTVKASGDEQDQKIIAMALGSDDNENFFQQDEGLGISMVFDINDPLARANILGHLRRVFDRFETLKRFKLKEDTIRWSEKAEELTLDFKYISLESDEVKDFGAKFTPAGSGASGNESSNT